MTSDVPIVLDNGTGFVKVRLRVHLQLSSLQTILDFFRGSLTSLSSAMQAPTSLNMSFPPLWAALFSVQRSV